jgi:molecular chaperone HscA
MSVDLDQMFASLQADANAIPLGTPEAARHRGAQIQRVRLGAAALAVAVVAAGITGGVAWLGRTHTNPNPPTSTLSPVPFVSLSPVRGADVPYGDATAGGRRLAMSTTVGDRAYLAWQQEGGPLKIGAIDLAAGRPAWPVQTLTGSGEFGGMIALPDALVVIAGLGAAQDARLKLMVLNPADGTRRWQREIDMKETPTDIIFYNSVLVLTPRNEDGSPATRQTIGLDWRTGQVIWSSPAPKGGVVQSFGMYVVADLANLHVILGESFGPNLNDHRLVQLGADGTARVYDAGTGALITSRPVGGTEIGTTYIGYEGKLFQWRPDEQPQRVRVYDLDRPGDAAVVYQASDPDRTVMSIAPCGSGRICLLQQAMTGPGSGATELVAVDVAARRTLWQHSVPAERVVSLGDRIMVSGGFGGSPAPTSKLFDETGKQLLKSDDQGGTAAWINAGGLLIFSDTVIGEAPGQVNEVTVGGINSADGRRVPLGKISVVLTGCSWTDRFLVCPAGTGFEVWRFARD